MFELDGSVSPVQISANVILTLSKTSVNFSEAETGSNLENQTLFLKDLSVNIHGHKKRPDQFQFHVFHVISLGFFSLRMNE